MAGAGKGGKAKAGGPMMKQLGKSGISNKFVHLRKIAQHPLLVRNLFSDSKVQRMASIAYTRSTVNHTSAMQIMVQSASCDEAVHAFMGSAAQCCWFTAE